MTHPARWRAALALALVLSCAAGTPSPAQETTQPQPLQQQPAVTQPATGEAEPATSAAEPAAGTPDASAAAEAAETPLADVGTDTAADPTLPHDLSPMGMFLAADIVVKSVMVGLALASVATWAILMVKFFEIQSAKARMRRVLKVLIAARGLSEANENIKTGRGAGGRLIIAASDELAKSETALDDVSLAGVKDRVASHLSRIEAGESKRIAIGTGLLATIGSIAPFVGLFGTVWGIMNAFIGISQAETTNLAVVAPGIAEALLATAIGLVAAIPAVIIYNSLNRSIGGYRLLVADASAAIERLVSRDLDFRALRQMKAIGRNEDRGVSDKPRSRMG